MNQASFENVTSCLMNWIGHVNRIDADRILGSIFNNQPKGNCPSWKHRKNEKNLLVVKSLYGR